MKEKSTILIVDDSELNRTVLADILGDEYNFIEAENGARAIELLRTHTDIDLILLDMVMPEMNGFDVLTAMNNNRQIEPFSTAIAVSQPNWTSSSLNSFRIAIPSTPNISHTANISVKAIVDIVRTRLAPLDTSGWAGAVSGSVVRVMTVASIWMI